MHGTEIHTGLTTTDWAQIISAIGTVAAATVAVVAAYLSYRSSRENRLLNESMTRPRVSVYVKSTEAVKSFIDLIISNDGSGVAKDLRFQVEGDDLDIDSHYPSIKKLSQLRVIKDGISVLSPNDKRVYYILSLMGKYDEILKKKTTIRIEYYSESKSTPYLDSFVLDFSSLSESGWQTDKEKAMKDIASELKQIRKSVQSKK